MATPLDITALTHFSGIFPFLFVVIITYAVLSKTPWFSDKPGSAGMLSFILGLVTLVSSVAIKTINLMLPWFVLFVIFGVLLLLVYMALGVEEKTITSILTESEYSGTFAIWVIAIMLIIGLGSFFQVINEEAPLAELQAGGSVTSQPTNTTENYDFWQTLFHPKMLGMILILLIAFFTIGRLVQM